MINFNLPGFYHHYALNKKLLMLKTNYSHFFYNNINIECFYDIPYFCIFDGGRIFINSDIQCSRETLEEMIQVYNYQYNTPIRLILTNTHLSPKDYYDRFGNMILELCENNINQITVSDDNFKDYILSRYPNYRLISSTTKCLTKPAELLQELQKDDYYLICLDYNLNKNLKLLESIPAEQKKKCEILCNAICPPGCPERKNHYRANSDFYLNYGKHMNLCNCLISGSTCSPITREYTNNLSPTDIFEIYAPMGFEQFKLEGRTLNSIELALNYIYYLIKPEYKDEALNLLLGELL